MELDFQKMVDSLTIEEVGKFRDKLDVEYNIRVNRLAQDIANLKARLIDARNLQTKKK